MEPVSLKLKQASAVLEASPKELQNLVQFGVLRPRKRRNVFVFDTSGLIEAKIALYLKSALCISTPRLCQFITALGARMPTLLRDKPTGILLLCPLRPESEKVEVKVPFRALVEKLNQRLSWTYLYRDLPRGRKRPGWKSEFLATLREAAQDMGNVSEREILDTIRQYRKERQQPEISVVSIP